MGAGKTLVAQVFETLRIPVFNADAEANTLSEENPDVKAAIKKLFGDDAYINGSYNRKHVASLIFTEPSLLDQLNAIIHPAVFKRFDEWAFEHATAPYVMKEAAILFESGADKTVDGSFEARLERANRRHGCARGRMDDPEPSGVSRRVAARGLPG